MSKPKLEHISTAMVGDVAVAEVQTRELRFPPQAQELGAELTLVASQDWAKKLLINFHRTKYIGSTGFAVLLNLIKKAESQGRIIKLCNLDPDVQIGADIIGLGQFVGIYDSEQAALQDFSRA